MLQLIIIGFCKGGLYALVALGFGLIYSTTRVMHIAHAGAFVTSAYVFYFCLVMLKLPLWVAILLGGVFAIGIGMLIEQLVYWPLSMRSASKHVLLISSLGVQIVLVNIITLFFGNTTQILFSGDRSVWQIASASVTSIQVAQFVCALLATLLLALFLKRTYLGQTIRALADDPELAMVTGVPVRRVRLAVLGLGSLFAYAGACLMALDVGIEPYSGFPMMLTAAVACIMGGLHHLLAPALGAFLLGIVQSLVIWKTSGRWEEAVTFGILVGFLLLRPQGILGIVKRADE